jgi:hypothetical protein
VRFGAAGLRTIPLRRFRQPWPALGPGPPFGARPCGFPPCRTDAMVLAGGGRLRGERSGRIRRPRFGIAARRRLDGLLLTPRSPATDRAGATGETGFATLTTDPTTSSAAASILPPGPGHRADAVLRAAFRYRRHGLSRPDQASGPSLVLARRRSWGSSLRRFDPSAGWTRRSARRRRAARQRLLSVASCTIATFLPVRAHVPFVPIVRPD